MKMLTKKLVLYLIIGLIFTGCAFTPKPTEVIFLENIEVHLYTSISDLQEKCVGGYGNEEECYGRRGFYTNGTIHCPKWDFWICGHELFHALQRRGVPMLEPDGNKHFGAY